MIAITPRNTTPSTLEYTPSNASNPNRTVTTIKIDQSNVTATSLSIVSGLTKAVSPKASPRLAILDPTTFPTTIPEEPLHAACRDANSSGDDVPIATTVNPTMSGEMFDFSAKPVAFRTSVSPPNARSARPPINKT